MRIFRYLKSFQAVLATLVLFIALLPVSAAGLTLTDEETKWLEEHRGTTLRYIIPPK